MRTKNKPKQFTVQQQYVSVGDAATILGISRCTVYRLVETHELPAYHIGERRIVIGIKEIDDFMQARRTVPAYYDNRRGRL